MRYLRSLLLLPIILLIAGCSLLVGGDPGQSQSYVVRRFVQGDLGLDIRGGEVVDWHDDHGGFHGDGETYVEVHFSDDALARKLALRDDWQPLPVSRDVRILLYGIEEGSVIRGPVLHSDGLEPWVPEIEHGYWTLLDRQPESYRSERRREDEPLGINNRYSWNLTIGLYDSDHHILYVLALDT